MIEVLKQALNVIEAAIKAGDWKVDGACDPDNVIYGLRQAIAELESQEPVAWEWRYDSCGRAVVNRFAVTDTPERTLFLKNVFARGPFPLFTYAPQRKPLTDDQIYEMYSEPRSDAEMLAFARAIEAAHGIKE